MIKLLLAIGICLLTSCSNCHITIKYVAYCGPIVDMRLQQLQSLQPTLVCDLWE